MAGDDGGLATLKAFVSSTFEDLKQHRRVVITALRKAGFSVDPMEDWTAAANKPKQFSQERLEGCDLCVLLVGLRRGHVPAGEELSITQLEQRAAVERGVDVLVFMLGEQAPWPRQFDELDKDPEIQRWREELMEHKGVGFFDHDPDSIEIAPALTRWLRERLRSARGAAAAGPPAVAASPRKSPPGPLPDRQPQGHRRFAAIAAAALIALAAAVGLWRQTGPRSSLQGFAIDEPGDGSQVPLGQARRTVLEGRIPNLGGIVLDVDVAKLPEGQEVPQDGEMRISSARGTWRYESASFAGEGEHEITVTAALGAESDFQQVVVTCLEKSEYYRAEIARERQARGAPAVATATQAEVSAGDLHDLRRQLYDLGNGFESRLRAGDLQGALTTVNRRMDLVDRVLPLFPDDAWLQNARAYALKDHAQLMRRSGRSEEARRGLGEAEAMFQAVRAQDPGDAPGDVAGAWNGLGSVTLERAEIDRLSGAARCEQLTLAWSYIDRALELYPSYQAAVGDLRNVEAGLENCP